MSKPPLTSNSTTRAVDNGQTLLCYPPNPFHRSAASGQPDLNLTGPMRAAPSRSKAAQDRRIPHCGPANPYFLSRGLGASSPCPATDGGSISDPLYSFSPHLVPPRPTLSRTRPPRRRNLNPSAPLDSVKHFGPMPRSRTARFSDPCIPSSGVRELWTLGVETTPPPSRTLTT